MKMVAAVMIVLVSVVAWAQAPASGPAGQAASGAASRPVDANVVAGLIEHLGHKDFTTREEATRTLGDIGDAVIPLLQAKAQEPNLDPEVAYRVAAVLEKLRIKESQPVREGGVDFQIVGPVLWQAPSRPEGTAIPLALKITNRTDKALQFTSLGSVTICLRDAAGKEIVRTDGVRRQWMFPPPMVVEKDQSGAVERAARLRPRDLAFRLTGPDGAGGTWFFDGLKPGRYSVSMTFQIAQGDVDLSKRRALTSDAEFWIGKVTTKELAIELTATPASQPSR